MGAALQESSQHLPVAAQRKPVDRSGRLREAGPRHFARLVKKLAYPLLSIALEPARRLPSGTMLAPHVSRPALCDQKGPVACNADGVVAKPEQDYADRDWLGDVGSQGRQVVMFRRRGNRERGSDGGLELGPILTLDKRESGRRFPCRARQPLPPVGVSARRHHFQGDGAFRLFQTVQISG